MTKDEVKQLFMAISMNYPSFDIFGKKLEFWHELLEDISFSRAMRNLKLHMKESKFIPTIADIRRERKMADEYNIYVTREEQEKMQ